MDRSEQEILQRRMAQFLVSEVFNTVSEEDVLRAVGPDQWSHKGRILSSGEIELLKKEAKQFGKMKLPEILGAELRWHAKDKLNKATTENDIIVAKLLSYFVDLLYNKIKKIETL